LLGDATGDRFADEELFLVGIDVSDEMLAVAKKDRPFEIEAGVAEIASAVDDANLE